uniref:Uncharacterized protein n=1 Tax=Anopheles minimus TaxID=112268 RepID=A0A182VY16_9DIPT
MRGVRRTHGAACASECARKFCEAKVHAVCYGGTTHAFLLHFAEVEVTWNTVQERGNHGCDTDPIDIQSISSG